MHLALHATERMPEWPFINRLQIKWPGAYRRRCEGPETTLGSALLTLQLCNTAFGSRSTSRDCREPGDVPEGTGLQGRLLSAKHACEHGHCDDSEDNAAIWHATCFRFRRIQPPTRELRGKSADGPGTWKSMVEKTLEKHAAPKRITHTSTRHHKCGEGAQTPQRQDTHGGEASTGRRDKKPRQKEHPPPLKRGSRCITASYMLCLHK